VSCQPARHRVLPERRACCADYDPEAGSRSAARRPRTLSQPPWNRRTPRHSGLHLHRGQAPTNHRARRSRLLPTDPRSPSSAGSHRYGGACWPALMGRRTRRCRLRPRDLWLPTSSGFREYGVEPDPVRLDRHGIRLLPRDLGFLGSAGSCQPEGGLGPRARRKRRPSPRGRRQHDRPGCWHGEANWCPAGRPVRRRPRPPADRQRRAWRGHLRVWRGRLVAGAGWPQSREGRRSPWLEGLGPEPGGLRGVGTGPRGQRPRPMWAEERCRPQRIDQKSTSTSAVAASSAGLSTAAPMPIFSLIFFSSSLARSGLSRRKFRAFSRPWPSWSLS